MAANRVTRCFQVIKGSFKQQENIKNIVEFIALEFDKSFKITKPTFKAICLNYRSADIGLSLIKWMMIGVNSCKKSGKE